MYAPNRHHITYIMLHVLSRSRKAARSPREPNTPGSPGTPSIMSLLPQRDNRGASLPLNRTDTLAKSLHERAGRLHVLGLEDDLEALCEGLNSPTLGVRPHNLGVGPR